MQRSSLLTSILALTFSAGFLPGSAKAQYYVQPQPAPSVFLLGTAHVDGFRDHDDIKVGRYAGLFYTIQLKVKDAPIQFDHVVIHYGNGTAETLPIGTFIGAGQTSRWIMLPGGRRVIRSLELWYSRAEPDNPSKPEVELFGAS